MSDDSEPVPKLPRGRGLKFSGPELFRIAMTLALLIAVILLARPCARAVSTFVMGFDGSGSAGSAGSAVQQLPPGIGSARLIPLKGLSDEQVRETVERAQGKRGSADGSAAPPAAAIRRRVGSAAPVGAP